MRIFAICCCLLAGIPFLHSQTFTHGVASGDPTAHTVQLWTRAAAEDGRSDVPLTWWVARDSAGKELITVGSAVAQAAHDYCVQVEAGGLPEGSKLFYAFQTGSAQSPIGRTRTAPAGEAQQLRFAVVSCQHYEHGYYHGYETINSLQNIDAVIHLGDYIYEYGHDAKHAERPHAPLHEIVTLSDYRTRYGQYRLDPHLQEAHRLYPFIVVWDDHEVSNNSYTGGAENHQPEKEGDWETRKSVAFQAHQEWIPMRRPEKGGIYRSFQFGALADLMMIDSRIEGRDKQIYDFADSALNAPDRHLLGQGQMDWLLSSMQSSVARWRIIGNQVLFSPFYAAHVNETFENQLLDSWDGYPAERRKITEALEKDGRKNVVILTGDFHASMVLDVPADDWNFPYTPEKPVEYDPETGAGAVAVEFMTPSISSYNIDDYIKKGYLGIPPIVTPVVMFEGSRRLRKARRPDPDGPGKMWVNPHLEYMDLARHGFLVLTLTPESASCEYYLERSAQQEKNRIRLRRSFRVKHGTNHVVRE